MNAPNLAGVFHSKDQLLRRDRLLIDDPQFRAAQPSPAIAEAVRQPGLSLSEVLATVFEGYAQRPALGMRATALVCDPATGRTTRKLLPSFDTLTYGQAWRRMQSLSAAWQQDAALRIEPGDLVCLLGFAGADYVVVDLALSCLGAVSVPMQNNASVETLRAIVEETAPRCLATSLQCLDAAVEVVIGGHRPASLLVFNYAPDDDDQREVFEAATQRLAAAGVTSPVLTLQALCDRGAALPPVPLHVPAPGDNPLRCLLYTSGSTGSPKGAMIQEHVVRSTWFSRASVPALSLVYMPMNHGMGRINVSTTLANGGTCYFVAQDDLSTLMDDIALVRPTSLALVPRIVEMVHHQFQRELSRVSTQIDDPAAARKAALDTMRDTRLGGRVLSVTGGSAPLSRDLRRFIEEDLDFKLLEGYGTTEISAFSLNNRVLRPPVIDYKLVDVPELGYFTTDKPHPRGELLVKTSTVMAGYYRRPDVTAEAFDPDGYYRTGDIMAEVEPDHLLYLDRRNNVLKLAQGEFVAVSQLETLFAHHDPLIRQVMFYGNSQQSFLVAVVVPNLDLVSPADTDDDIKRRLRETFKAVAEREHLHAYEVPRDCLIERTPFSAENGLLSGVGKLLRPVAKARYGERLEQLYDDIARQQADELHRLRAESGDVPVLVTLARAAKAVLGLDHLDADEPASFRDLGGDSLSALSFSLLLEETFGIEVPVAVIADPSGDLRRLAAYIEKARSQASAGEATVASVTVASVHGPSATLARASDLVLEAFIDQPTLQRAAGLAPAGTAIRTVLVTGATGFLGRFLCLEWLERMARCGGRVICIARGRHDAEARQRVAEAFDSGDATLRTHFETLAAAHLEVLAGDIGDVRFGLAPAQWDRLAETVDVIVHPAALVNHMLPYAQLFRPNVVGTAELIRLALSTRLKRIHNISSVAVALRAQAPADEDADIRRVSPAHAIDVDHYASGYAISKWAGEVLLREAHERFGLSVANFRCDMILPHRRYAGQMNPTDMLTRWLFSLLATGVAPTSLYHNHAAAAAPHYDGLPVDFIASAIATIGEAWHSGHQTWHVVNPHDDGVSMDTFVEWAIAAGEPITRLDHYTDWFNRFAAALRALPEEQRQRSSLPLLQQWVEPMPAHPPVVVTAPRFEASIRQHGLGDGGTIPHLSESFIRKYIGDLRHLGWLKSAPPPSTPR